MLLVTGGAGYVGSHFVHTYLEKHPQEEIVVVDNLSEGHREALAALPKVHLTEQNIGDANAMRDVFSQWRDIDCVVHFAANAYVGESQQNPPKYFRNNVINTLSLLESMQEAGVRKLVFSSTCATYGNPVEIPISETHPQNPVNVYGLTKLMIEQALKAYGERLGWSYVALRYFNAAGAAENGLIGESHAPETHLIPLALQTAAGEREHLEIFGDDYDTPDHTCIRDYIHVTDLAEAHCAAVEQLRKEQPPMSLAINLGTEHGASVREVIDVCGKVTGKQIPVKISPRRAGDPPKLVADARQARELLGWTPSRNLHQIIETAWNWECKRRF